MAKTEKLFKLIEGTALVQEVLAEKQARELEQRKQLSNTIAKLDRNIPAVYQKLDAKIAASHQARLDAKAALDAAERAHGENVRARLLAANNYSQERDSAENALREGASHLIPEFISLMADEWKRTRKSFSFERGTVMRNEITGAKTVSVADNASAVNARIAAIREAMQTAEAMRLDPDQSKVPERLTALRANLPKIT